MILNSVSQSGRLSMEALGLHVYIQSLPEDWVVNKKELIRHFKNGRRMMNSAFKELQEAGLLLSVEIRGKNGRLGYNHMSYPSFQLDLPDTLSPVRSDGSTVPGPLQRNTNEKHTELSSSENFSLEDREPEEKLGMNRRTDNPGECSKLEQPSWYQ